MAIVNHKNILTSGFDEDALTTTASGQHILNFGYLTTTGDLANGIFVDANDVSIRNISGRSGLFVDAVGLICGEMPPF